MGPYGSAGEIFVQGNAPGRAPAPVEPAWPTAQPTPRERPPQSRTSAPSTKRRAQELFRRGDRDLWRERVGRGIRVAYHQSPTH